MKVETPAAAAEGPTMNASFFCALAGFADLSRAGGRSNRSPRAVPSANYAGRRGVHRREHRGGEVKARDPDPGWSATLAAPDGQVDPQERATGATKSIPVSHRGSVAPSQPCSANNAKQVVRVPYTYHFIGHCSG